MVLPRNEQPMGKAEIAAKFAARKAKSEAWTFVGHILKLIAWWPLLLCITVSIASSASQILLQDMTVDKKTLWILTQNWPNLLIWIVAYYGIRRSNKFLGW